MADATGSKVYIGNLNKDTTDAALTAQFAAAGTVTNIEIAASRTFGWVTFSSAAEAERALGMAGTSIDGYEIKVEPHKPRARAEPADGEDVETRGDPMRVFVGNVPRSVEDDAIEKTFSVAGGEISGIRRASARGAVRNLYITYTTVEAADAAVALNGTELEGQRIRVEKEARRARRRRRRREGDGAGAGGAPAAEEEPRDPVPGNPKKVFVGNLGRETDPEDLKAHFAACGEIESVKALRRGFGYVTFADEASVAAALALTGSTLNEREINVQAEMRRPRRRRRAAAGAGAGAAAASSGEGAGAGAGAGGRAGRRARRRAGGAGRRRTEGSDDEEEVEGPPSGNPNTVWVGNLPEEVTEDAVNGALSSFGEVARVHIGRNGKFAYVEFAADASATASIEAAAAGSVSLGGSVLKIEAENRSRGRVAANPCRVYVGNLPETAEEDDIRALLDSAGTIARVTLRKGFAYVVFAEPDQASAAQTIIGTIDGNDIRVESARPRRLRGARRRGGETA